MRALQRANAHRVSLLLTLTLVLVAALGAGIWLKISRADDAVANGQQELSTRYSLAPMERTPRRTALFIGDDFAAGFEGVYVYAYPYVICDAFDLNCNVDAENGTGVISNGQSYSPSNSRLVERLPRDQQIYDADLIVVDAGRNDVAAGVAAYGQAMKQFLLEVKRSWPSATIAVIAPAPMTTQPYREYGDIVSILGQITKSLGAVLIDPIAEGWYNGVNVSEYQSRDGNHPNQKGQALIAQKLAESLVDHKLVQKKLPRQ
jgi:lysophospholipase L1-like esterase